ncbi:hypothetical protein AMAG_09786 [Allomyces macrogynus ATCC 38327]|uniref:Uncharacterized protein n=1 Tax=Allomyces macrogynus (strain ATCC 38327) TaxID=578462 RepID=A0A0L0SU02_ALLM3|nr:hypothetical protein AMAG_09786 [Allomyces macrogynus ATCC 38327]|eukprot:KNE65814.1 hypothetical protein AMAG_09786 [Allomyces macrogynus ATCC 38327]
MDQPPAEMFKMWQDVGNALESDNMEVLTMGCRAVKAHLRLLFHADESVREAAQRVIVDYIENVPDQRHIWSALQWSLSHRALLATVLDIIGLFLAAPIPLPTHRLPMFRRLLRDHQQVLLSTLLANKYAGTVISTVRTLTQAVRCGLVQDLVDTELFRAYPNLAFQPRQEKPVEDGVESDKKRTTVRSTYLQFVSALLRSDSATRKRVLDSRDFIGPVVKGFEKDPPESVTDVLSALKVLLDDHKVPRTPKVAMFNSFVLDSIRRLYNVPTHREIAHEFLIELCTVAGRGLCFKEFGLYAPPSHKMANRILSFLVLKLELTDELQFDLLVRILASCPELVPHFMTKATMTLDPRPSSRWMTNMRLTSTLIAHSLPSLLDPAHPDVEIYPQDPPTIASLLAHVAPSPPVTRANLTRGLNLTSPIVLFFTMQLLVAMLEKLEGTLLALEKAAAWWIGRDTDVHERWVQMRATVVTQFAKILPDFVTIQKCLINALTHLEAGKYDLSTIADPALKDLEACEDVQPSMVYLCALRVIKLHSALLPDLTPPFDSSKLLAPLPPLDLVPELLSLLIVIPPSLTPKSLSTLLKVHATGEFADLSTALLTKLLQSSTIFAACPDEVRWWLIAFPASVDVIVFVTNLFGMASQRVYALLDVVAKCTEADAELAVETPFSPMLVALVSQLSASAKDGGKAMSDEIRSYVLRVLGRVRDVQMSPAPLARLLETYPIGTTDLPDESTEHPLLALGRALQSLPQVAADSVDKVIDQVDAILATHAGSPHLRACVLTVIQHPAIRRLVDQRPEQIVQLLSRYSLPLTRNGDHGDAALANAQRGLLSVFRTTLHDAPSDQLCRAITVAYQQLNENLELNVPLDHLTPAQWLLLMPVLARVPDPVYGHLFATTAVDEAILDLMLGALAPQFPIPGVGSLALRPSAAAVTMEHILVSCIPTILAADLDASASSRVETVLAILAAYSSRHHAQLLEQVRTRVTNGDLADMPFRALVALVVREAQLVGDAVFPDSGVPLSSVVVGWRSCQSAEDQVEFLALAVEHLAQAEPENISADALQFLASVVPAADESQITIADGEKLVATLLAVGSEPAYRLLKALVLHVLPQQTPAKTAKLLQALFDHLAESDEDGNDDKPARAAVDQVHVLCLILSVMASSPAKLCKQDYLLVLIKLYKATLHPRDLAIFAIFHLYETQAQTHLGRYLLFWGQSTKLTAHQSIQDSILLVNPEHMAWSMRHVPLEMDLETVVHCDEQLDPMITALTEGQSFPYDPRFFVPLTLKYLEQGNTIDIRLLLERNLIGLAVSSLASVVPDVRRAALLVLDEFYALIETAKIPGKMSVTLVMDLLKNHITNRSATNPTRLPAVIAVFLAMALDVLDQPESEIFEPMHQYLLARPLLNAESIPLFRDLMFRTTKERQWLLQLLAAGLRAGDDVAMYRHRHAWDTLMTLADAASTPSYHQRLMTQVLFVTCAQAACALKDAEKLERAPVPEKKDDVMEVDGPADEANEKADEPVAAADKDDEGDDKPVDLLSGAALGMHTLEPIVFASGLLPYLHHSIHQTTKSPAHLTHLLALARVLGLVAQAARTDMQRDHVALIAEAILHHLVALDVSRRDPDSVRYWLHVLVAITRVSHRAATCALVDRVVRDIEAEHGAKLAETVVGGDGKADFAARLEVATRWSLAGFSMVEQIDQDVPLAALYRQIVRELAPHAPAMWTRAVAVCGDEAAFAGRTVVLV